MNKVFKVFVLSIFATFFAISAHAQDGDVKWNTKINGLGNNSFEIVFDAQVEAGWHIYDLGPYEIGPLPTAFIFEGTEGLTLDGTPYLLTPAHKEFDDIFEVEIGYFEKTASFAQKVTLTAPTATLKGYVEWMVCNDTGCSPPREWVFAVELKADNAATLATGTTGTPDEPAMSGMEGDDKSIWGLILEAIIWGLAALVTPCVFPMIPMTVSFFLKGSENKSRARFRASAFGIFIVVLYTLPIAAIILATWIFGGDTVTADIFNWLATHWIPNIIFFLVFMIFAASFFGAFEIALPSKFVNKSDRNADRGGLGGVFFMALTLVLVSFSCTGPLVGNVLIRSTSGEFWTPIITMLAFSITFAIPFTLFAFFPSLLTKMKSGSWLNSVKVVLGFVELALGLKFLLMADQSYQWGLLDREIYLALWIAIFSLLGLYLLGKIKFKYDSDLKFVSVPRLAMAIIVFAFVAYMLPGMWGAPLKGLGGYIPKLETQDFVTLSTKDNQLSMLLQSGGTQTAHISIPGVPEPGKGKYSESLHVAAGLKGFFTMEEGMAYSKAAGKPMFVDFTGHACANCIKMEENVIKDAEVFRILNEEFVIVALFGDDKRVLPEDEWTVSSSGRTRKQLGQINSDFVAAKYKASAQPTYIICDNEGNMLIPHVGYTPDKQDFIKYLRTGIDAYKNGK